MKLKKTELVLAEDHKLGHLNVLQKGDINMAANGVVKEAAANELSSTKAQALEENNKMLAAKALDNPVTVAE